MFFIDALLRHNIFPLQHWVQRRGALLEALYRISEGFFFGPHHLIMAALLLLCQILEHLGYPTEPQLERKRICREIFTLDKWMNMTAYRQSREPNWSRAARGATAIETPADTRAPALALCHTLQTLTTSQSILTQEMAALRAHQEQIIATQTQHTAILRQIQSHLGIPSAPQHQMPAPLEPTEPTLGDTQTST
ncbi:hypothetical protein CK203_037233 [Vitis vinifera]|uniref:Uncharacterized protein n=1 Tax=Vitis vinifera TaxID=29760 RepID=A0A438HS82_VITVI|nr:hypothetical protein CK203_037233 [Vitis vinifera]